MRFIKSVLAIGVCAFAPILQAAITFTAAPPALVSGQTSTGTFTPAPLYTITPLTNLASPDIVLTGDFYSLNPGAGDLLSWYVDRPISASSSGTNTLTVNYTGFISAPGATAAFAGGGYLRSSIFNNLTGASLPGTVAQVNFTYSGALTNYTLTNTSPSFTYTFALGDVLHMEYSAQGAGYAGTVDLNFPAEVVVTPVPEPTTAMLILAGFGALAVRRRRK